jgi:uncharacterized membrane protein YeaQ/YmgE (transglycosylase-associated protein family)
MRAVGRERLARPNPAIGTIQPLRWVRLGRRKEAKMLAADVDITVVDVIVYIVAGLIIGAVARLLLPGRQEIGMVATIVIGVVAAVLGGLLWETIFPGNDGIAWVGSIIVGVVLVWLYVAYLAPGRGRTTVND